MLKYLKSVLSKFEKYVNARFICEPCWLVGWLPCQLGKYMAGWFADWLAIWLFLAYWLDKNRLS